MGLTFPEPCNLCGKDISIERGNQNTIIIHYYDAEDNLKANISYWLCNECSRLVVKALSDIEKIKRFSKEEEKNERN